VTHDEWHGLLWLIFFVELGAIAVLHFIDAGAL
jgi:hypothetical protein